MVSARDDGSVSLVFVSRLPRVFLRGYAPRARVFLRGLLAPCPRFPSGLRARARVFLRGYAPRARVFLRGLLAQYPLMLFGGYAPPCPLMLFGGYAPPCPAAGRFRAPCTHGRGFA